MKRLLASLACAVFVAASAAAAPASRFGLEVSVVPQGGLVFAGSFDPGFSGLALGVTPFFQSRLLRVEAGIEAGTSPLGWQVLAPLRAGVRLDRAPFDMEVLVEAAPGVALFRPAPLFVIGVGGLGRVAWTVARGFAITASAGLRWTACPAWVQYTGSGYSTLDAPLSLGVRWTFGLPGAVPQGPAL